MRNKGKYYKFIKGIKEIIDLGDKIWIYSNRVEDDKKLIERKFKDIFNQKVDLEIKDKFIIAKKFGS